jgi:hypothetical protein
MVIKTGELGHIYIADMQEKEAFDYLKDKIIAKSLGLAYKKEPIKLGLVHLETRGVKKEEGEETGLLKNYYEFTAIDKEEYSVFVPAKTYEAATNKVSSLNVFLKIRKGEEVAQKAYFFFPNSKTLEEPKKNKGEVISNLPVELCEPENMKKEKKAKIEEEDKN